MNSKYECVPELSLKSFTTGNAVERQAFQKALYQGFKHFGFIILKDHGIKHVLLRRAYDLSAAFFALPEEEKKLYAAGPDGQRGYTPFGREHAKDSQFPDLKEFWHVGRQFDMGSPLAQFYAPNLWPARPVNFYETFTALYAALEQAGLSMLEALAPSLGVADDYFRAMATDGNSILRLLHYSPVPNSAGPNQVRAAAHEDINLITILVAANGGGLELLDRDGNWLPVETDPDNLIVDAGDMLARICNDVVPATTHRVVNPSGPNVSRYSMPFFMHPHPDAVLSCLECCKTAENDFTAKYPDIIADDFLKQRLRALGLAA